MEPLSKENLLGNNIELDESLIHEYPIIQPTLFVEFNPVDKHIMDDPSQRPELLLNLFQTEVEDYGNKIPFVQFLYQNNIKLAVSIYPSDKERDGMKDVFKLLDKWSVVSELWIGMKDEDGAYTNLSNLDKTREAIDSTILWAKKIGINVNSIGVDLEPNIDLMRNKDVKHFSNYTKNIRQVPGSKIDEFNNYLININNSGIKINQYRGIKGFGSSAKIKPIDNNIIMYYSSVVPPIISNILIKALYNPETEVVATGIIERGSLVSNHPFYTPGRLFSEAKTNHLTEEDLYRDIHDTYVKYLLEKKDAFSKNELNEFFPIDMYFFALDHPDVARVIRNTLNKVQNDVYHSKK